MVAQKLGRGYCHDNLISGELVEFHQVLLKHYEKKFPQYILDNFEELQSYLTENFRKRLLEVYNPISLVNHTYELLLQNLEGVEVE